MLMFGEKFKRLDEVSCSNFQGSCNGRCSLTFPKRPGGSSLPPHLGSLLSQHSLCL